jgi:rhodanese-related sulfurtransferase
MAAAPSFEISVDDLAQRRGETVAVLDVREAWELDICRLPKSLCIPLASLPGRLEELPRDGTLVVVCHHGMRSAHAVQWLRTNGFPHAVNLAGGIDAWARQIDPAMRTY